MKIEPKNGPAIIPPPTGTVSTPASTPARDRAIAKLTGQAPQGQSTDLPVKNASNVSPEELSAIKQSSRQTTTTEATQSTQTVDNSSTQQAAKTEAKATETKEETPLSSQYAMLARRERALRAKAQQQEQAIREKEAAIKAQEEAFKAREAEYASKYIAKDKVLQDPLSVLIEAGFQQDQIAQMLLNPPAKADPALKATLDRLEAQVKAQDEVIKQSQKAQEEAQKQQYQQAVNQIRQDVKSLVDTGDQFEMIKASNSVNDVVELIEKTFEKDGYILSVEEAAQAVEDYLVEEAIKFSRLNKIQQKLKPVEAPKATTETQKLDNSQQSQIKTLTNAVQSASAKLSARERAILAFEGKLNK